MKTIAVITALLFPMITMGQLTAETIEAEPFTGVSASGIIAVEITQADEFFVEVETTAEQLEDVRVRVRRNTLELEYTGKSRRPDEITVYVAAPVFNQLSGSGAARFTSTNAIVTPSLTLSGSGAVNMDLAVETEELMTNISGATNLRLSGRATYHELKASGACLVNAYDLVTDISDFILSGASNARIQVTDVLKVTASGSSTLSFRGRPDSQQIATSGLSRVTGDSDQNAIDTSPAVDTVTVRVGQREIQVVDGRTQRTQVNVKRRPYRTFRDNWSGFELGINGFLSPDNRINLPAESEQFDLDYRKSIAVNLNLWQQNLVLVRGHLGLVTGIGVGWNNYRFLTNDVMVKGPQQVEFTEGEYDFRKNKLTLTYLNVPLLLEAQTTGSRSYQKFHLAAGLNVGLRLRSHTKQMVFIDGNREKFKDHKDFYINPFRYEATARIGWGHINLFASYALNQLFKDDRGPELTPFSVGIRLVSF